MYVKLPREASKARLTINAGQDMDGQLLWFFDDDMLALRIPADHMMIVRTFEQSVCEKPRSAPSASKKTMR
jgi:hypothetical protein